MTALEDRLASELSQLAGLARPDTIRPLREPARRWSRRLAPLATTAAVAAVAILIAVAGPWLRQPAGPPAPSAPSLVSAGTVPPYYMVAFQSYGGAGGKFATYAALHSTATGKTLARVTLPSLYYQGGWYAPSITAAADDRTFVVMESNLTSKNDIVWLFRLQVGAGGRSIAVTRLPVKVPPDVAINDVALSPDGTRLAMTAQWGCGKQTCQHTGIRVVSLATDAATIWSTGAAGAPFNGSWVSDSAVAFEWQADRGATPATGYRVLPLTGAPADLLTSSHPVASPRAESHDYVPGALVTPDGRTVVTSALHGDVASVVELDARTGRLERTLYSAPGASQASCDVLSLGPGGAHPLADCNNAIGAVINGQLVSMPGFPSPSSSGMDGQEAIAW